MTEKQDWTFNGIRTERLFVGYIDETHANEIFNEKNKPEVNLYLASKSANSVENLLKRIESVKKDNRDQKIIQLQVEKIIDGEFLGLCGIKKPNDGHPEIGLRLKQSSRGHGYGKELVGGLINWIQENLRYEYIIYETFEKNISSVQIIKGFGGVYNHTEEKENYFGDVLDHVQYRIYRSS